MFKFKLTGPSLTSVIKVNCFWKCHISWLHNLYDPLFIHHLACEIACIESGCVLWKMLSVPHVRRALILGCLLQLFQQIIGINTVMYVISLCKIQMKCTIWWEKSINRSICQSLNQLNPSVKKWPHTVVYKLSGKT